MTTCTIDYFPELRKWRVSVYRGFALEHSAWFFTRLAAEAYAGAFE